MAKPLNERITNALANERTPDNQLEQLIEEAKADLDRLAASHAQKSAESIDFALSEADRDAAAASAERYARNAAALSAAIPRLEEQLAAKRNSDSRKAAEAEREAVLAERDSLADEFKALVEPAVVAMLELFPRIEANAERMRRLGIHQPNAEAMARGLVGFNGMAGDPEPFLKLKIPNFSGRGRCWPPDRMNEVAVKAMVATEANRAAQIANEKRTREAKAKRIADHAKVFGRYLLTVSNYAVTIPLPEEIVERTEGLPKRLGSFQPWQGELAHADAELLGKVTHLTVERLDKAPRVRRPPPAQYGATI